MRFFVGTSGFSYKEWKGSFYPEKLPQKEMLGYYAARLSAVEINNTFYRMPKSSVIESWAAQVPDGFRFVLKASQRITHFMRLKNAEEPTAYLLRAASVLGQKRGPLLFQLPPNLKKDVATLQAFLECLDGCPAAFEFRHESWFDEAVFEALRACSCALCHADVDDGDSAHDLVSTADWGYVRLRRESYTDEDLQRWVERFRAQRWNEAYVFFKHEDAATGPMLAARFVELTGSTSLNQM
jgi:uncharacterized protein YecE (DUF72 family)